MQEFSAHYADTGEECAELTAKDCGRILTGVSEEGYQSSALIDGQDQALSAGELGDRMLALSTTGDSAMMYSNAVAQLDHWRNALRGTGNRGRYAQVEADIAQLTQSIGRLDDLSEQIQNYEAQVPEAEQRIADAENEARAILADAQERADHMVEESEIIRQAREEARTIKNDARVEASETRLKASHDAYQLLAGIEDELNEAFKTIRRRRKELGDEAE